MYSCPQGNYVVALNVLRKQYSNNVVYGGLFHCPDIAFYLRLLDAYHACSMSTLRRNHIKDTHHRILTDVRPIVFSNLEELRRLQYKEQDPIQAYLYYANPKHPNVKKRLLGRQTQSRFRVVSGVEREPFLALYAQQKGGE